ncbi:MAG TPA: 2-phospho-L-lactate guanylyltransferase [Anaerolineae bacterium]
MIALVPVKTLARAKSRLAGTLDPPARAQLMHDTLRRTLQALHDIESITQVVVITRDDEVSDWARQWGAVVLHEHDDGLNESLREARTQYAEADSLLIVPADLGWLEAQDIRAMVALADLSPAVVIAPDRHDRGTNALLLRPPDVIDFRFGQGSAQAHAQLAQDKGITAQWYRSNSTSLDVDDPSDLALYGAAPYLL